MKLTAKARYGLKTMCYLAKHREEKAIPLPTMANDLNLSDSYVEQLLLVLRKAGLVEASRGVGGGYYLERANSDISVGEILRALEDELVFVDCISKGCQNSEKCSTYDVWQKLYKEINGFLDSMSLESILR